jgi:Xaa-Pro aminopeptidase
VVTETGVENLTAALPRTVDELESWFAKHSQ